MHLEFINMIEKQSIQISKNELPVSINGFCDDEEISPKTLRHLNAFTLSNKFLLNYLCHTHKNLKLALLMDFPLKLNTS